MSKKIDALKLIIAGQRDYIKALDAGLSGLKEQRNKYDYENARCNENEGLASEWEASLGEDENVI